MNAGRRGDPEPICFEFREGDADDVEIVGYHERLTTCPRLPTPAGC